MLESIRVFWSKQAIHSCLCCFNGHRTAIFSDSASHIRDAILRHCRPTVPSRGPSPLQGARYTVHYFSLFLSIITSSMFRCHVASSRHRIILIHASLHSSHFYFPIHLCSTSFEASIILAYKRCLVASTGSGHPAWSIYLRLLGATRCFSRVAFYLWALNCQA